MIISEQEKAIHSSADAAKIMSTILASEHETDQGREHFWAAGVNTKNIIQYIELVSLGSLSTAIVHPREVFRLAIMKGVAAIIFCHNHPSGDLTPSQEDIELTKRLRDAGQILGIGVMDHVIIGKSEQGFSFRDEGVLFFPWSKPAQVNNKEDQPRGVSSPTKKTDDDEWGFPASL